MAFSRLASEIVISDLGGGQVGLGQLDGRLGLGELGVGGLDPRLGRVLGGLGGHVLVFLLVHELLLDGVAAGQRGEPVERLLAVRARGHRLLEGRPRLA